MTSCRHCTPKDQSTDVSRGCVSLGLNPHKKRNCWCLGFLSAKGKSMWRSEGHGKTLNDGIYQNVFVPSEDISEVVCILYSYPFKDCIVGVMFLFNRYLLVVLLSAI